MNTIPDAPIVVPATASEAFAFIAQQATAHAEEAPFWPQVASVCSTIADWLKPTDFTASHVKWAYEITLKRIPESAQESGPIVEWLANVPACEDTKPGALLFHYLMFCAGQHLAQIPLVQGKSGSLSYRKGSLLVPVSNEEAYQIAAQKAFWQHYQGRLFRALGLLLREICGWMEVVDKTKVKAMIEEQAKSAAAQESAEKPDAEVIAVDFGAKS